MNRFSRLVLAMGLAAIGTLFPATAYPTPAGQASEPKSPSAQGKQEQPGQQGGSAAPAPQKEEIDALQAIQNELDPDKAVQMVGDFEKKFPASTYIGFVFLKGAFAYQQKGDLPHIVEYGEKSLKVQADNPVALILVASALPEPQSLQGSDLDKEKKLTQAAEYSNRALQLVDKMSKQPNMTDEQFAQNKASLSSWAHSSLGMVHLQRSSMSLQGLDRAELERAQQELKTSVALSPRPDPSTYYRLGEAFSMDDKADEAIEAFSKASQFGEGTALKRLADDQVQKLRKKRSEAKPPAKP